MPRYITLFFILFATLFSTVIIQAEEINEETNKEKLSTEKAAQELFSLMKMDRMIDAVYGQVDAVMQTMMHEYGISQEEKVVVDEYIAKVQKIMQDEFSWEDMQDIAVQAYAEAFTTKEINDMIDFYKTPTGQKTIDVMPQLSQRMMVLMQGNMAGMVQKIKQLTEEIAAEQQAKQ